MPTEPTIERKQYSDHRAKAVMLTALRGRGAKLTRADAIAASGLPDDDAERALTALLKDYRSHLSATASGELLYEFDPKFARRDAVRFRERAAAAVAAAADVLWRGFSFLFKIAIVATLITYFVAFVAMMVALIFARSSGSSDRDDDDGGFGIGPMFWFWGGGDPGPGAYGRRAARARETAPRVPFYKRVFAFVFGPPAPKVDPLEDEKRIVAYIRSRNGRVAPVDLVRLMGWSFPRAEEEATQLMVDYGGEPEVTDDGVVVYTFKALRRTASAPAQAAAPAWASERLEPTPPLTGNQPGTNALVGIFNGFNLLAPFWIVPAFESRLHVSLASWHFALVDFPIAFSALFFAVPLGRWIKGRIEDRARRARNDRRRLLGLIFAGAGGPRLREELAPTPALAAMLDRELVSLGGDVAAEPDARGRVRYTFPRIEQETAALARIRAAAPADERDAGAIVFSSSD